MMSVWGFATSRSSRARVPGHVGKGRGRVERREEGALRGRGTHACRATGARAERGCLGWDAVARMPGGAPPRREGGRAPRGLGHPRHTSARLGTARARLAHRLCARRVTRACVRLRVRGCWVRPRRARGAGARTDARPRFSPPGWRGRRGRAPIARKRCERIYGTKAEPQRIVATRPLCRVQHPVPHSSRLQGRSLALSLAPPATRRLHAA